MTPDYRYACCEHCDPDADILDGKIHDDGHPEPCPDGCNDGEGEA